MGNYENIKAASYLLPDPAGEVVRGLIGDYEKLEAENKVLKLALEIAVNNTSKVLLKCAKAGGCDSCINVDKNGFCVGQYDVDDCLKKAKELLEMEAK